LVLKKLITTDIRVSLVAAAVRNCGEEPPITCVTTTGLNCLLPLACPVAESRGETMSNW